MFSSDSASSAQTDTVLVAAPGAGKRIRVQQVYVSSDSALKVTTRSQQSGKPSPASVSPQ